ncbi:MAG: hypothetical protein DMF97_13685 [Acidobacteria bacterium]|nr:MAG: hypothetical protein DMF97_13685 [Acidobacteriota bacterium]
MAIAQQTSVVLDGQEARRASRTMGAPREGGEIRRDSGVDRSRRPIETGDDLIEWVNASDGKGLGFGQKKR